MRSSTTFSILFWVYSQRADKNNETNIYVRITIDGQKANISLNQKVNIKSWDSLSPLLQHTDVKDITKHFSFEVATDDGDDATYFRLGAYRMGVNIKQKDYLLFSPPLFEQMQDSGLNRKAMWPKKKPQWSTYKEVTNRNNAASEHPLVWGSFW
ncbi:Arm DNA-binding domain-containing protein [Allomuricauda sp. R78024]|uniref:Arm DNA-binding domain-containing protein n=1 Tax=Allomuricauda sp. R78024 TaxID=3093867 RepID=UPI0037C5B285